jgi:hypothetical protein
MEPTPSVEITVLLKAWSGGDRGAMDRLAPLISNELRRMARHYMRGERDGHTLQATALVNEAWVRLVDAAAAVKIYLTGPILLATLDPWTLRHLALLEKQSPTLRTLITA